MRNAPAMGLVGLGKTHMSELAFSGPRAEPGHRDAALRERSRRGARRLVVGRRHLGRLRPRARPGSDPTPAARSASPRPGTISSASRPPPAGCRSKGSCRSRRASTPSARCAAPSKTRACCWPRSKAARRRPHRRHPPGPRFLVLRNGLKDVRDAPRAGFDSAVGRLKDGGRRDRTRRDRVVDEALALSAILFTTEAYATWREVIEAQPDRMFRRDPRTFPRRRPVRCRRLHRRLETPRRDPQGVSRR